MSQENGSKLKPQTPASFNRKPNNSTCRRGSNSVSIVRNKPSVKCLSAKKKNKFSQASKPTVEHEKPISPVRGILKNPTKIISGQNTAMCNMRATTEENTCDVQNSVRHVSFSGKDDILGPQMKHVTSFEKSVCRIDSDPFDLSNKGQWIEGDKEFPAREINGSDDEDVPFRTENGIAVQAMMEKQQLPGIHQNVDIPKLLRPPIIEEERANHFSDKAPPPGQVVLDSSNLHMPNQGNQPAFSSPSYTGVPRFFPALKEIQNPFVDSRICDGLSAASNHSSRFVDYFGDHPQEVSTITAKANPRASLQPSSSGFSLSKDANESAPFTPQFASINVSGHALSHQPLYHLSPPIEQMGRLCPFPEWKHKAIVFTEKYRDGEFFGLPLNSQGELVQANSSGTGGFNQLKDPASGSSNSISNLVLPRRVDDHSIMKGKHFTDSPFPNNQLNLFPAQNQMTDNATVNSTARVGATQLLGASKDVRCLNPDRAGNHSFSLMDSDLNLTKISSSGCSQYDQFQNQKERGITQASASATAADRMLPNSPPPTMRLMGKDVTICRSSDERQGYADGKVWTDKEIIREHHPQGSALQSSYVDRHLQQDWSLNPASGKYKTSPVQQIDIETNQAFPSNVLMKPLESNFFQPGPNWRANPESHSSTLAVARNPIPNSHHFPRPSTSHSIFDSGADFPDHFVSGNETLRVSSHLPSASTSHRIYQNINDSSVELRYKQNLPNAVRSSFNFPFLHPDHGDHVQPSWFRPGPSKSLIPWLLQATQQGKAPTACQPFPDVGTRPYPHATQSSFLANPLVPHLPVVSYDHNSMISHSHMESPVGHPSILHSPLVPALPGIRPTSINMSHRNRIMVKERMKLKNVGIQDPDICQKTRKRPGAEEDYLLMNPIKIPNLGNLDESRAAARLTRENFVDDIQCHRGSLEIDPYRDETGLIGWIPNESQCNGFGTSAGIDDDSSKVDGELRPGLVKLSAGVKHILKPSQNVDRDNSRLIHSTIPFAPVADCDSILETQMKSTKIYRF
ncbi:hypothetical protein COLO4_33721 [Corchorus olitorius]|uniref:Uncharacterized protein n=1 Tax=Corchorus olitorius TaxID=93759 RepID=A0A1R3GRW4_9ROSI|nr:hypothetical protein COLO4_33721 [Corchorus olitorius]